MFNRARWWSEKNKIKVVFKLQFHASQLAQTGGNGLVISVVPADAGKPTVKSDKAAVRDGSCLWENPVYETVKFNQDPKSGKIHARIYYFVIGSGSSKAGVVGEASVDFSSYAKANKISMVSLPLKNSKTEAVLHVSIQRIHESTEHREIKESENATKLFTKDDGYRSQNGITDEDDIRRNSVEVTTSNNTVSVMAESNMKRQASCGSDITMSSSESSSGISEPQIKNDNTHQGLKSDAPTPICEQQRTSWEWVGNSTGDGSTDGSSSTPRDTFPKTLSKDDPNIVVEELKSELAALSRQAETYELELQGLRKQIVKENKRGQDLWREICCLKEERDALKATCEQFKASQRHTNEAESKDNLLFDSVNSQGMMKELRQELDHTKELNSNLRIQLQKTQDSNSELLLAVQDLEEMLQQKNGEMPNQLSESLVRGMFENSQGRATMCQSDDDEQKALEEIVQEHSDAKEAQLLKQQIMDLHSEIEIYRRDKDELQIQLEQLALDYEIVKQENHNLSYRLEQCQIQEKLTATHELETQMENLENELERRSKEYADSLVTINELKAHAMSLEEELDKQAQGFEADLDMLTRAKVEQEQRAIRAEEALKKLQWKNADTAERLQEEFRILSLQMTSSFATNEKLAVKAMAEANELLSQKRHLEEMLRRTSEEHQSVEDQYNDTLDQLANQVTLMTNELEQTKLEIEDKTLQLDYHKRHTEETLRVLSEKNLMLKEEIEMHKAKNKILLVDKGNKETLIHELEQMRQSLKEKELLVEKQNNETIELRNRAALIHDEAYKTHKELTKMRCQVKEKESMFGNLYSEVGFLQAQITELKSSLLASELDKEKLRTQVSDLKKRGDTLKNADRKMKDGIGRGSLDMVKGSLKTSKPLPYGPKEVANLKERIKWLEDQIKSKETALETSVNLFLEKEKDLHNKILELEGKLEVLNQSSAYVCLNEADKVSNKNECADTLLKSQYIEELKTEVALLNERNTSMEVELRYMLERYSEISLKFAEVEGERQKLVMKLRNLSNSKKSLHIPQSAPVR